MEISKLIWALLFSVLMFGSCVREDDDPPGCHTPDVPAIKTGRTVFNEGEEITLEAIAPEGEENGAFEWQGPNKYFLTQDRVRIASAKELHEGEYKLLYLNEGRCRSKPASVFITVYSFAETCGLNQNTARIESADHDIMEVSNIQESRAVSGNYIVMAETDSIEISVRFPTNERPATKTSYMITEYTGSQLAKNELDILVSLNGEIYHAVKNPQKTANVFLHNGALHIAFCGLTFINEAGGKSEEITANIVVP